MVYHDDVLAAYREPEIKEEQRDDFNIDEFRERKQQERDLVYDMIDDATLNLTAPEALKEYLDIQSRFNRYRPSNILLIQTQMPLASRLNTFDEWKNRNISIRKGEHPILILMPGKQYTRYDGTIGQYTDVRKVFDISQTFSAPKLKPPSYPEGRTLIRALMNKSPVPAKASENVPDGCSAYYDPNDKVIYVRPGMAAHNIFRDLSSVLANIELTRNSGDDLTCGNAHLSADCVSYLLCREHGVDVSSFDFRGASQAFIGMDTKDIRAELCDIRKTAGEISGRMESVIQQERAAKEQEEAR